MKKVIYLVIFIVVGALLYTFSIMFISCNDDVWHLQLPNDFRLKEHYYVEFKPHSCSCIFSNPFVDIAKYQSGEILLRSVENDSIIHVGSIPDHHLFSLDVRTNGDSILLYVAFSDDYPSLESPWILLENQHR